MSTPKYTPWPWTGGRECINSPDGTLIAAIQFVGFNGSQIPTEEGHANSALISAAPEMLEMLKMCESIFAKEPAHGPDSRLSLQDFKCIQAVIAKAEGRS